MLSCIYYNFFQHNAIDSEFLPSLVKNIPLCFTVLGLILSIMLIHCLFTSKRSVYLAKKHSFFRTIYTFLSQK